MAHEDPQALRLGGGNRPAEDVAGVCLERFVVETAICEADGRVPLPRNDPESLEVGHDLHVAEVDLVPDPGPVGHDPAMVDGEDRDAEVEAVLARSLELVQRDDLGPRGADEVGVVDADASDARLGELAQACRPPSALVVG